jgi:hypothetical protein
MIHSCQSVDDVDLLTSSQAGNPSRAKSLAKLMTAFHFLVVLHNVNGLII